MICQNLSKKVYFSTCVLYNNGMKRVEQTLIKQLKKVDIAKPNNIRVCLYAMPMGDVSIKREFTEFDLASIELLDSQAKINPALFEYGPTSHEGDVRALMDEGVLKGISTGADLGIYNYKQVSDDNMQIAFEAIKDYSIKTIKPNEEVNFFDNDKFDPNYMFRNCLLAGEDYIGSNQTELIYTFRGYLEVTMPDKEFSILRKSQFDGSKFSLVYIPQYYVHKYQLRNGDEIVCSCIKDNGKMLLDSLFTINEIYYRDWICARPWINEMHIRKEAEEVNAKENYGSVVSKRFKLYKGDNVFIYVNKNTQKSEVVKPLISELRALFDKVVYINPQHKLSSDIGEGHNVVNFCVSASESYLNQQCIALLGANYAKRLIELGKNVAIVVDSIDAITALDNEYGDEHPVCKTILGVARSTKYGSATSFTLIPLRSEIVDNIPQYNMFRSYESLGIVVDNGEIDLYNSYRV